MWEAVYIPESAIHARHRGATFAMPRKPERVCSWLLNGEPPATVPDAEVVHGRTVFIEDKSHDWDWRDGQFKFYSRLIPTAISNDEEWNEKGVWILVDFEKGW